VSGTERSATGEKRRNGYGSVEVALFVDLGGFTDVFGVDVGAVLVFEFVSDVVKLLFSAPLGRERVVDFEDTVVGNLGEFGGSSEILGDLWPSLVLSDLRLLFESVRGDNEFVPVDLAPRPLSLA